MFNCLIFPHPTPSYNQFYFVQESAKLISIPSKLIKGKSHSIPCLQLRYQNSNYQVSNEYLIYFHGNAEDMGMSYSFLLSIQDILRVNILVMEYPGYGVYAGQSASESLIKSDAEDLYNYLVIDQNISSSNIYIFGRQGFIVQYNIKFNRSLGSGPASYLAAKFSCKALILMSPYKSIRTVAGDLVHCFKYFVSDMFKNIDELPKLKCPILIIHGQADQVIRFHHTEALFQILPQNIFKKKHTPRLMTHNDYDFQADIGEPIRQFMKTVQKDKSQQDDQNIQLFKK